MTRASSLLSAPLLACALSACAGRPPEVVAPGPAIALVPTGAALEDTAPKENLRMVPPEVYMRTYLQLFGGLAPVAVQRRARAGDGAALFDTWDDYVSALGFPDYRLDIPRQSQTNAVMVAAFERLGVALCDRALEHDLKSKAPLPAAERLIFAFDLPKTPIDAATFAPRFDVLHRTFLGYPSHLAPAERTARFLELYRAIAREHAKSSPHSRLSPDEAAWAAVCYGLVRHPEFHLY